MKFPLGYAFVFRVTSLRVVSKVKLWRILHLVLQYSDAPLQSKVKDVILFQVLLSPSVATTLLSEMQAELKGLEKLSWTLI